MRRAALPLVLAVTFSLGACAVPPPTGPLVMALPGQGKNFEAFQQDDAACRQFATQQTGGASAAFGGVQQLYNVSYTQCMYAHGNTVQAPPSGYASYPYPYPYPAYPYVYPGYYGPAFLAPSVAIGFGGGWGGGWHGGGWGGGWHGGGWHH
jgi:hypothetical protein